MVERLIVFEDDERSVVAEIRERFQRRKDKLRERRVYPLKVRGWGERRVYPLKVQGGGRGGG